jgi:linoleoyl-CoA desaturase
LRLPLMGKSSIVRREEDAMTNVCAPVAALPRYAAESAFLRELRARVHLRLGAVEPKGGMALHLKAAEIAIWFAASWAVELLATTSWLRLLAAGSLGIASAAAGFGIFHDAGHGTFARTRRHNLVVSRIVCALLGPSRFFWHIKHQVLHHSHPNVPGWDDDLETRGVFRYYESQAWRPRVRWQHWFAPALYCLNTVQWFFLKDFVEYWRGELNPFQRCPRMTASDHVEFWATKAIYAAVIVLPPFFVMPLRDALLALALLHVGFSAMLTFVFQVAHLTPEVRFGQPLPGDDWASHQLRTTADFSTGSPVVTWLTGGLNHQIEHHLFPNLAHTFYPKIAPIVAETAREFGLPYHNLGGFRRAFTRHMDLLRSLAAPPVSSA